MIPLTSIYIGAIGTLIIFAFHTQFYRLFKWDEKFATLGVMTRKILYTIHLALTFFFLLIGILSLVYANELSQSTGLALGFNIGYACLWIWRIIWQFTYMSHRFNIKLLWASIIPLAYIIPVIYSFI